MVESSLLFIIIWIQLFSLLLINKRIKRVRFRVDVISEALATSVTNNLELAAELNVIVNNEIGRVPEEIRGVVSSYLSRKIYDTTERYKLVKNDRSNLTDASFIDSYLNVSELERQIEGFANYIKIVEEINAINRRDFGLFLSDLSINSDNSQFNQDLKILVIKHVRNNVRDTVNVLCRGLTNKNTTKECNTKTADKSKFNDFLSSNDIKLAIAELSKLAENENTKADIALVSSSFSWGNSMFTSGIINEKTYSDHINLIKKRLVVVSQSV